MKAESYHAFLVLALLLSLINSAIRKPHKSAKAKQRELLQLPKEFEALNPYFNGSELTPAHAIKRVHALIGRIGNLKDKCNKNFYQIKSYISANQALKRRQEQLSNPHLFGPANGSPASLDFQQTEREFAAFMESRKMLRPNLSGFQPLGLNLPQANAQMIQLDGALLQNMKNMNNQQIYQNRFPNANNLNGNGNNNNNNRNIPNDQLDKMIQQNNLQAIPNASDINENDFVHDMKKNEMAKRAAEQKIMAEEMQHKNEQDAVDVSLSEKENNSEERRKLFDQYPLHNYGSIGSHEGNFQKLTAPDDEDFQKMLAGIDLGKGGSSASESKKSAKKFRNLA